ncbi:MAG TPA: hypothetical protein DCS07_13825 [Bdellovibrionales bacterium]|nr:hypothetical protein [Bdellovibrionales bacterium]
MLIVKNYDQKKMIAQVAEPSTDGSRLVEYNFSLSTDPDDKEYRKIRPGLANLRLMAEDNAACRYRDVTAGKKK